MSSDCGASDEAKGTRKLRCIGLWVAGVAVFAGVVLPLGIEAWRQVSAGCRRAQAADRHEERAAAFFKKGDFLSAANAYGLARAVSNEPRLMLAESRARLSYLADHVEAIDPKNVMPIRVDCEWLLADDAGSSPVYWTVLGHLAAFEGRMDESLQLYNKALDLQPLQIGARLGKGMISRKKGDNATARECLNTVVQLRPEQWDALLTLAELESAAGDNGRAIELYQRAIALKDDARLRMGLGRVHLARKDFESAVASLRKATELDPKLADAWVELGNLYLSAGALQQAEQALRGALQARADPVVAGTLAAVLNRLNRPSEALQVLTPLLQQQAGPAALTEAARSLESLGRKEEAWSVYQAAGEALRKMGDAVEPSSVEPLIREIEAARQRIGPAAPKPTGK
jgi:tetratricopeptide (TPR) repeat protein